MTRQTPSAGRETIAAVLALTAALTVVMAAFAWPVSELEPRQLPVAVTGPEPVVQELRAGLGQAFGPDAFELTAVASRDDAVAAIEDREVYGAIVLTRPTAEVLTASAASPAVAQLLTQVGSSLPGADHFGPAATDVVPPPDADPRGLVFGAAAFPLVLGGVATAVLLVLRVPRRRSRILAATGVAVGAGLALTALLQYWLDALSGSYLANAGVVALALAAVTMALIGLRQAFGMPGLGLGAAVVMLLGNPLSGFTSAPELLPDGWSVLGQFLPPGAGGTALRSTAFFDGAGAATPVLVLACWVAVGLGLAMVRSENSGLG